MVDDHLMTFLFQGLGDPAGHVDRAVPSTRTTHRNAEVRFELRGIPGQEVRYQVHDPMDRFVDLAGGDVVTAAMRSPAGVACPSPRTERHVSITSAVRPLRWTTRDTRSS